MKINSQLDSYCPFVLLNNFVINLRRTEKLIKLMQIKRLLSACSFFPSWVVDDMIVVEDELVLVLHKVSKNHSEWKKIKKIHRTNLVCNRIPRHYDQYLHPHPRCVHNLLAHFHPHDQHQISNQNRDWDHENHPFGMMGTYAEYESGLYGDAKGQTDYVHEALDQY